MIKTLISALVVSSLFLLGASQKTRGEEVHAITDLKPTVLLVSIDGFRHDYLDAYTLPNLQEVARQGVRAESITPAFPTLTFPNHYSIITGLYPAHHGIVSNEFKNPQTGELFQFYNAPVADNPKWWGGEPLWVTAVKQGQKSATMFWPGSTVDSAAMHPTYWKPYNYDLPKTDRVNQVLTWLDLPQAERPTFLTLYFEDVDSAGHAKGPATPEVKKAAKDVDGAIGQLMDGLKARQIDQKMTIFFVSDHGMAATDPAKIVVLEDYVDIAQMEVVGSGPFTQIYPKAGQEDAIYQRLKGANPLMTIYKKNEIPARLHYSDSALIAPIVALAGEGASVVAKRRPVNKGAHGYDNAFPDMQGLFIARGPTLKNGFVSGPIANIHVYPMITKILGLKPAKVDGDVRATEKLFK